MAPLAKGLPLKAVLVNDNSAGNDALMVGPKIKSFADLKGKTIALEEFSVSHFVLVTALAKNGMSAEGREGGQPDALATRLRRSWAAASMPQSCGIRGSTRSRRAARAKPLFTSKDMPGLIPDLLVAQEKSIEANRKDFVGMIKAWYETEKFIREQARRGRQDHVQGRELEARRIQGVPAGHAILRRRRTTWRRSAPAEAAIAGRAWRRPSPSSCTDNKLIEGKPDSAKGARRLAGERGREVGDVRVPVGAAARACPACGRFAGR